MLLSLGMFVFSLDTVEYQELEHRYAWRHSDAGRVGARPASQFLGPGEEGVNLSGQITREFSDAVSLDDIKAMADQGDAYPLVGGDGSVFGSFVITELSKRGAVLLRDGTPLKLDFHLALKRVDDPPAQAAFPNAPWG